MVNEGIVLGHKISERGTSVDRRGGPRSRGARPPPSWAPPFFPDVHSKSPGSRLFQKDRSRKFHSVWTPFDIHFLRNTEIGKKTADCTGPSVNRLVPKII